MKSFTRRDFLMSSTAAAFAAGFAGSSLHGAEPAKNAADAKKSEPPFKISLAEWSLHRSIFGKQVDHLDFAKTAKQDFGIEAVEYVNQFFMDKAKDHAYLGEMKKRCDDMGVKSLLIM